MYIDNLLITFQLSNKIENDKPIRNFSSRRTVSHQDGNSNKQNILLIPDTSIPNVGHCTNYES